MSSDEYAQLIVEQGLTDSSEKGIKDDEGKVDIQKGFVEYFPRAMEEVARVSGFGARKYAWGNWKLLDNAFERYKAAQARHQVALAKGEKIDPDSNLQHIAHIAWNAMACLEINQVQKETKKDHDGLK